MFTYLYITAENQIIFGRYKMIACLKEREGAFYADTGLDWSLFLLSIVFGRLWKG